MSPEELEVAYDQSEWAANMQDVLARYRLLRSEMRAMTGEPTRIPVGLPRKRGWISIVQTRPARLLWVLVHGGG